MLRFTVLFSYLKLPKIGPFFSKSRHRFLKIEKVVNELALHWQTCRSDACSTGKQPVALKSWSLQFVSAKRKSDYLLRAYRFGVCVERAERSWLWSVCIFGVCVQSDVLTQEAPDKLCGGHCVLARSWVRRRTMLGTMILKRFLRNGLSCDFLFGFLFSSNGLNAATNWSTHCPTALFEQEIKWTFPQRQ